MLLVLMTSSGLCDSLAEACMLGRQLDTFLTDLLSFGLANYALSEFELMAEELMIDSIIKVSRWCKIEWQQFLIVFCLPTNIFYKVYSASMFLLNFLVIELNFVFLFRFSYFTTM